MTDAQAKRIKGFLGLCYRAGQVILGQDACVDAIRRNTAALVLLDEASTATSRKRFSNACNSHQVPLYETPAGLIAQALGKDGRMAAAVRHGSMAKKLAELVQEDSLTGETTKLGPNDKDTNNAGVKAEI